MEGFMYKKILCCFLFFSLIFTGLSVNAQEPIDVVLDGWVLEFDVPPAIIDGRTMVPMRAIFEALGANVEWNGATQTITATKDDIVVKAVIGNRTIDVNGSRTQMDVAPLIIGGRTLVPARFVSQAFGADVVWAAGSRTVFITSVAHKQSALEFSGYESDLWDDDWDLDGWEWND
jgi:hypothetical protein